MIIYHCSTPKLSRKYHETGYIRSPIRGFNTLAAAIAWGIPHGRTIVYRIESKDQLTYKLPDHHNKWGTAHWTEDQDATAIDKLVTVVNNRDKDVVTALLKSMSKQTLDTLNPTVKEKIE